MSSIYWLRLEGFILLLLSVFAYFQMRYSWLLFILLLFVPDISMVGYLKNAQFGAIIYNVFHVYLWPALLLILGWLLYPALVPLALIWFAHIGLDRMLGYGLKLPSGFKDTHLGSIGR
jgi:hypothetical protein